MRPLRSIALLASLLLVASPWGLAACAGNGEPGSGAAYMSPPFGEYTTPSGPTDLAPDARVSRSADPFLRTPTLPPRR